MGHDDTDPEKLKEILSVVSTEIPALVESITKILYNTDNAENMGKAVAQFYKQMKDAGMDEKQAFELTQKFMSSFSLGGLISSAIQGDQFDKIGDEIERKIDMKIKKKLGEDD